MTVVHLITSLCLAVGSSAPESIGVLAVAPPPGAGPELAEITEKLRNELARKVEGVLEGRELRERMQGRPSAASLSELDRAYDAAVESMKRDPVRGTDWLRVILSDLDKQPDSPEAFEQWRRAALRLARARLDYAASPEDAEQGTTEARQILERMVRVDPALVVDPDVYGKKLERLSSEVKAEVRQIPKRRLVVKATEGVLVFVEGREVGKAPVTLSLPQGSYRVSGQKGQLRGQSVMVSLAGQDETMELDFSLADMARPAQGPGLALPPDRDEERWMVRFAMWLGLDRVVTTRFVLERDVTFLVAKLVQVKPHPTTLRAGWVRLSGNAMPMGSYADLAGFLITGQSAGLVADKPPPPPKVAAVSLSPAPSAASMAKGLDLSVSRAKGWWSVGFTGAAVLAGGILTWQAISATGHYSDARAMLDSSGALPPANFSAYHQQLANGDSARRNAIIAGVSAGAFLTAAGILGYLNHRQTGELWPIHF